MKKTLMIISIFLVATTLCGWIFSDKKKEKMESLSSEKAAVLVERQPFNGVTAVNIDSSCRPDKCQEQCKEACSGLMGEECHMPFDVYQECLKAYPPKEPITDALAMHTEMAGCLAQHQKEFEEFRCLFAYDGLDFRLFTSADPAGKCREIFGAYQGCLKEYVLPAGPDAAMETVKAIRSCHERYAEELTANMCALATERNSRRLYGMDPPDAVSCYIQCGELIKW